MWFSWESYGYRNDAVMVDGGMSPTAGRVTGRCQSPRDLTREVINSGLADIKFRECGLELLPGTLGGQFTTIEGLVADIENPFKEQQSILERRLRTRRRCGS
jgi:zinc finger protein